MRIPAPLTAAVLISVLAVFVAVRAGLIGRIACSLDHHEISRSGFVENVGFVSNCDRCGRVKIVGPHYHGVWFKR